MINKRPNEYVIEINTFYGGIIKFDLQHWRDTIYNETLSSQYRIQQWCLNKRFRVSRLYHRLDLHSHISYTSLYLGWLWAFLRYLATETPTGDIFDRKAKIVHRNVNTCAACRYSCWCKTVCDCVWPAIISFIKEVTCIY